jgi:hypothetical protein
MYDLFDLRRTRQRRALGANTLATQPAAAGTVFQVPIGVIMLTM